MKVNPTPAVLCNFDNGLQIELLKTVKYTMYNMCCSHILQMLFNNSQAMICVSCHLTRSVLSLVIQPLKNFHCIQRKDRCHNVNLWVMNYRLCRRSHNTVKAKLCILFLLSAYSLFESIFSLAMICKLKIWAYFSLSLKLQLCSEKVCTLFKPKITV